MPFNIEGTGAGSTLYDGAFDNTYFNSSPGSLAGHMYVCGKDTAHTDRPAIYQLSFVAATGYVTDSAEPLACRRAA